MDSKNLKEKSVVDIPMTAQEAKKQAEQFKRKAKEMKKIADELAEREYLDLLARIGKIVEDVSGRKIDEDDVSAFEIYIKGNGRTDILNVIKKPDSNEEKAVKSTKNKDTDSPKNKVNGSKRNAKVSSNEILSKATNESSKETQNATPNEATEANSVETIGSNETSDVIAEASINTIPLLKTI